MNHMPIVMQKMMTNPSIWGYPIWTNPLWQDSNPMWNESIALAFPKKFEDVPIEDSRLQFAASGGCLFFCLSIG